MQSQATEQVIIYSAEWCSWCKTEKEYLDRLGVKYTVRDIDKDDSAMSELLSKVGGKTSSVPVTDIGGEIIRGFDRAKLDVALKEKQLIS